MPNNKFTISIKLGNKSIHFDIKDDPDLCKIEVGIDSFAGKWIKASTDIVAPKHQRDVPKALRNIADELNKMMDCVSYQKFQAAIENLAIHELNEGE